MLFDTSLVSSFISSRISNQISFTNQTPIDSFHLPDKESTEEFANIICKAHLARQTHLKLFLSSICTKESSALSDTPLLGDRGNPSHETSRNRKTA